MGSSDVSREVLDGGALPTTGVLTESGDLVSCIGDVASCAIPEKVDISDDGAVVEPMVEGRRWKLSLENHDGFGWCWLQRRTLREVYILHNLVYQVMLRKLNLTVG